MYKYGLTFSTVYREFPSTSIVLCTCSSLIIRIFPNGPTFFISAMGGGECTQTAVTGLFPVVRLVARCPFYAGHGLMDTSNGIGVFLFIWRFFFNDDLSAPYEHRSVHCDCRRLAGKRRRQLRS